MGMQVLCVWYAFSLLPASHNDSVGLYDAVAKLIEAEERRCMHI